MFRREEAFGRWRDHMRAGGAVRDLDALERSLAAEADTLEARGLSAEEAFLVAVRRLGGRDELGAEPARDQPGRRALPRLFWLASGVMLWGLAGYVVSLINLLVALGVGFLRSGRVRACADRFAASRWLVPAAVSAYVALSFAKVFWPRAQPFERVWALREIILSLRTGERLWALGAPLVVATLVLVGWRALRSEGAAPARR